MKSIKLGAVALAGDGNDSSLIMKGIIKWINWYFDLPSLTSVTSNGNSFMRPRSVTLSSLIWVNIWDRYS